MANGLLVKAINPSAAEALKLANIYNEYSYFDSEGNINPLDERYRSGGGHWNRSLEWFLERTAEGGRVIALFHDEKIVGYALFYVDRAQFPTFVHDLDWAAKIDGVDGRLAYANMVAIKKDDRRKGGAWMLMEGVRQECHAAGCRAISSELITAPIPNEVSFQMHRKMIREWGTIDTGRDIVHDLEIGSKRFQMIYRQYLIPTTTGERFTEVDGELKLIIAS